MPDAPVTQSRLNGSGLRFAHQTVISLAFGVLAYAALHFYFRDVGHFILDYTEPSWGRLWPRRFWLFLHMTGATVALFCGPFQLWSGLRRRHLVIHRWTGRLYVGGVLLGGAAAFYLSVYAEPTDFGVALFGLATAWWFTVGMAFLAIKRHRIGAHKEWMICGYVVTFSFVTFRLWIDLPMWSSLGSARLAIVLWLSWVAPLLLTEVLLRWRETVGRRIGAHGN